MVAMVDAAQGGLAFMPEGEACELLLHYLSAGIFFHDQSIDHFELSLGGQRCCVPNVAGMEEEMERGTALFLLSLVMDLANAQQKREASELILVYGSGQLHCLLAELGFNSINLTLALLSTRACELDKELAGYLSQLETLQISPVYWPEEETA